MLKLMVFSICIGFYCYYFVVIFVKLLLSLTRFFLGFLMKWPLNVRCIQYVKNIDCIHRKTEFSQSDKVEAHQI